MKKIFAALIILSLNLVMLNSVTFNLDKNFTLLAKKGNFNLESELFAYTASNNNEETLTVETEKLKTRFAKQKLFYINISPAFMPGIALGYGYTSQEENSSINKETIFYLHANSILLVSSGGIGLLTNIFKNPERKGFFYSINSGLDIIIKNTAFSPGGSTGESSLQTFVFPNLSLGGGYSYKISKTSYFRVSLDFGIKFLLTNLNLSLVF